MYDLVQFPQRLGEKKAPLLTKTSVGYLVYTLLDRCVTKVLCKNSCVIFLHNVV